MLRVCFKPITWYIEMHHVRTFFLCDVIAFSYSVMFIHNVFIFEKKADRCLSAEDKIRSGQIQSGFLDAFDAINLKRAVSFPLEDKHVVKVMDKTLTPSPWTTLMDYPKIDYP